MYPVWICALVFLGVHSEAASTRKPSCSDAEDNCSDLVAFIDICNSRPESAAFLCAHTCNMCDVDPGSVTNPTASLPHHTQKTQQTNQNTHTQSTHGNTQNHHVTSNSIGHPVTTMQPSSGGSISCTKHRDATVTIPDSNFRTCYYLYDANKHYQDAKKMCEKGGTHMVHLETDAEEQRLNQLMSGLHHPDQFWLGMESVNGQWMWTGNGQQTAVTDDLWEGSHDPSSGGNQYAYNTPPNHWKVGSDGMEYKVMCEENM